MVNNKTKPKAMPDHKNQRHSPDSRRINPNENHEVQYWKTKFGITENQLKKAVEKAGTSRDAILNYLRR
ncbi:MAG: DUF3606 domain-containing protein [Bacteroidia bacterium]